jgi:ferredoxin
MPTVIFERTRFEIEVPEGGRIVDLCDSYPRAAIPFSCRGANCGTCRVQILEGLEICESPGPDEMEMLEYLHADKDIRLGCQLRVRPGPGRVRLRVTL